MLKYWFSFSNGFGSGLGHLNTWIYFDLNSYITALTNSASFSFFNLPINSNQLPRSWKKTPHNMTLPSKCFAASFLLAVALLPVTFLCRLYIFRWCTLWLSLGYCFRVPSCIHFLTPNCLYWDQITFNWCRFLIRLPLKVLASTDSLRIMQLYDDCTCPLKFSL